MVLDSFDYTVNAGSTAAVSVVVICQAGGVAGDSVPSPNRPGRSARRRKSADARHAHAATQVAGSSSAEGSLGVQAPAPEADIDDSGHLHIP
jgi:hypothetical protein